MWAIKVQKNSIYYRFATPQVGKMDSSFFVRSKLFYNITSNQESSSTQKIGYLPSKYPLWLHKLPKSAFFARQCILNSVCPILKSFYLLFEHLCLCLIQGYVSVIQLQMGSNPIELFCQCIEILESPLIKIELILKFHETS